MRVQGWDLLVGFTAANLDGVFAEQMRDHLAGPVEVEELRCRMGAPRVTIDWRLGAVLSWPLADVQLGGRALGSDLCVALRADLRLESPGWDELLAHPRLHEDVAFALERLLRSGAVSRERHAPAVLRPAFTALDVNAALVPAASRLDALGGDAPRVLALLERWWRGLDDRRNPFFAGLVILARTSPAAGAPFEPTAAGLAYLFHPSRPSRGLVTMALMCDGRPPPPPPDDGRPVIEPHDYAPPGGGDFQGMLGVMPGLLLDHLVRAALRRTLGLGDDLTRTHEYPRSASFEDAEVTLIVLERIHAVVRGQLAAGAEPGALVVEVVYERRALEKRAWLRLRQREQRGDPDDALLAAEDPYRPLHGKLTVTLTCRFAVIERALRVRTELHTAQWLDDDTAARFERARTIRGFGGDVARCFELALRDHAPELAELGRLDLANLLERCVLPGKNQYSFRDPEVRRSTRFDAPFGLYLGLARNA